MTEVWYQVIVIHGTGGGKTLGFPTINLDPNILDNSYKQGVYQSWVKYNNKIYLGALYFGPRFINSETKPILEIHILDFNQDIYGQLIEFKLGKYIRGVKKFASIELLIKQIEQDIIIIREID